MQAEPRYDDVVAEVIDLPGRARRGRHRRPAWRASGSGSIPASASARPLDHNLALLADLRQLAALGFPVVLGVSRKRFIQAIDPAALEPHSRLGGERRRRRWSARDAGVAAVRVHDVATTVQALAVCARRSRQRHASRTSISAAS